MEYFASRTQASMQKNSFTPHNMFGLEQDHSVIKWFTIFTGNLSTIFYFNYSKEMIDQIFFFKSAFISQRNHLKTK